MRPNVYTLYVDFGTSTSPNEKYTFTRRRLVLRLVILSTAPLQFMVVPEDFLIPQCSSVRWGPRASVTSVKGQLHRRVAECIDLPKRVPVHRGCLNLPCSFNKIYPSAEI